MRARRSPLLLRKFSDAAVVAGSAITVAMFAACAPSLVVPAEGTSLHYQMCGRTPQGALVLAYEASCPDLDRVAERLRRVKERYRDCSLDGVRIHIVGAYLECDGDEVRACTVGNLISITADAFVIPSVEHEGNHVCISQRDGPDGLAHFDLDRRKGRTTGLGLMRSAREDDDD